MEIKITPEMLAEARAKLAKDNSMMADVVDPGTENICIGCE